MSIEERDFADHMNELLSDVLVSSSRMADLFFSDTDEILALIKRGSLEDDD
jgi:tRNA(His) 5'-end guanylyltransferase